MQTAFAHAQGGDARLRVGRLRLVDRDERQRIRRRTIPLGVVVDAHVVDLEEVGKLHLEKPRIGLAPLLRLASGRKPAVRTDLAVAAGLGRDEHELGNVRHGEVLLADARVHLAEVCGIGLRPLVVGERQAELQRALVAVQAVDLERQHAEDRQVHVIRRRDRILPLIVEHLELVDEPLLEPSIPCQARALEGMSPQDIAVRLNQSGILSPMEYKKSLGMKFATSFKANPQAVWSANAVLRILKNQVYIGVLTQGKETTPNYKVRKRVTKPEDEWTVIPDPENPAEGFCFFGAKVDLDDYMMGLLKAQRPAVHFAGDIDGDGEVTEKDLTKLKNYLAYQNQIKNGLASEHLSKDWSLTADELDAADVNGDGVVDREDEKTLKNLIKGK